MDTAHDHPLATSVTWPAAGKKIATAALTIDAVSAVVKACKPSISAEAAAPLTKLPASYPSDDRTSRRPGRPPAADNRFGSLHHLELQLRNFNLRVQDVGGGGDCAFCVYLSILNIPVAANNLLVIRRVVADFVLLPQHRDFFTAQLDVNDPHQSSLEVYSAYIRQPGKWGDHMSHTAFANYTGVPLVIVFAGSSGEMQRLIYRPSGSASDNGNVMAYVTDHFMAVRDVTQSSQPRQEPSRPKLPTRSRSSSSTSSQATPAAAASNSSREGEPNVRQIGASGATEELVHSDKCKRIQQCNKCGKEHHYGSTCERR